jgi:hypothetical protein
VRERVQPLDLVICSYGRACESADPTSRLRSARVCCCTLSRLASHRPPCVSPSQVFDDRYSCLCHESYDL